MYVSKRNIYPYIKTIYYMYVLKNRTGGNPQMQGEGDGGEGQPGLG
jgi:hypothetical protein